MDYTIRNEGNIAIDSLPVNITLLDPDLGSSVVVAEDTVSHIDLNDTTASTKSFSTHGLAIKQYTVLLKAVINNQSVTLASKPILITDANAPIVTILSPEDGATYHSKFNLTVEAKDADSGVDRVEYQMDEGQWAALPLIDPSQSRYSIGFTPSEQNVGDHVFRFRGVDTKGNASSPVFTIIHITPKMDIPQTLAEIISERTRICPSTLPYRTRDGRKT